MGKEKETETETKNPVMYDYKNQCWIVNGIIQACNHPAEMDCRCYGRIHQGEETREGE